MGFAALLLHLQQQLAVKASDQALLSIKVTRRAGVAIWEEVRDRSICFSKSEDFLPLAATVPRWFEIYGVRVEVGER